MKKRPLTLIALSLFLVGVAISFPIQIALLYGVSPFDLVAIATKLAPLNWAVMLFCVVTAHQLYHASPWLLATLPALITLVIRNNTFVAELSTDFTPTQVTAATIGFLAVFLTLLGSSTRQLLLNADLRWWRTPTRRRTVVPIRIAGLSHAKTDELFTTYDISENGVFIQSLRNDSDEADDKCFENAVPLHVKITLYLDGIDGKRPISCEAEVVRRITSKDATHEFRKISHYPPGIGLRFKKMSFLTRRFLKNWIEQIKKESQLEGSQGATLQAKTSQDPSNKIA